MIVPRFVQYLYNICGYSESLEGTPRGGGGGWKEGCVAKKGENEALLTKARRCTRLALLLLKISHDLPSLFQIRPDSLWRAYDR